MHIKHLTIRTLYKIYENDGLIVELAYKLEESLCINIIEILINNFIFFGIKSLVQSHSQPYFKTWFFIPKN